MVNGATVVTLGHAINGGSIYNLFDGSMAGGPGGPVFEQAEWTDAQIKNIYELQRRLLGV